MISGTASATITISDPKTQVAVGQKLTPETRITSDAPGGLEITYNVPATSGGTFSGGIAIAPVFLTSQGHPGHGFVIKLCAAGCLQLCRCIAGQSSV